MRLLVTGAAGFLGSHLTQSLLANGHQVLGIDNFHTGNRENLSAILNNPGFELRIHNVTSPLYVEVDGIFNLACPASPVHYQSDPVKTFETSVYGAINMLRLARRTGARFFQASTSEVYGDPIVSPQPEEYWGNVNPIGIRSCYDESKRAAEALTFDYHRQYSVDVRVARIFNTYGPKMAINDGRVVSNFIVQALRNNPISVYGDGSQTRSFCYVDDLIEGLIKLFFAEGVKEPINLGNPEPISMLELANEVIELTGSKSKVEMRELPGDDPRQREPKIDKARDLLGWTPLTKRHDGLMKTIEYFKSQLN